MKISDQPTGLTCPLCQESIGFGQLLKKRKNGSVVHVVCEFEQEEQLATEDAEAERLYDLSQGEDGSHYPHWNTRTEG